MAYEKAEEHRLLEALRDLDRLLQSEQWDDPQPKNVGMSLAARRAGNELYADPKRKHDVQVHLEALRHYSRSVAFALPGSEELGLAYGNRSALLAHLGRYRASILDVERALELPVDELRVVKYLCRKVECQAALGMQEAKETCQLVRDLLQNMEASDETKKGVVVKLVNAIVRLEKGEIAVDVEAEDERRTDLHPQLAAKLRDRSEECPDASSALLITKTGRNVRYGRHLTATREIFPGEPLYAGEPYLAMPMMTRVHSHCSHCLRFLWAGLPCDGCSQAMYCSEACRTEAYRLYHDVECKILDRAWKVCGSRMNAGRFMSVRILLMAMRTAGGLHELRDSLVELDACTDLRKKGFSNNARVFLSNYGSAYSLLTNVRKKEDDELKEVSEDSAVLLYLLADRARVFRKYFGSDKKDLVKSEDALFVGKLLSHFQHVVLVNAISVKDTYNVSFTDWSWTVPREDNCSGLYLNPFLSFLNHSCFPNVARCETKEGKTILYAIRPILKGEQIFDCYGPMYSEMPKTQRQKLIKRFYFTCDCIACAEDWPLFMNMISNGVTFTTLSPAIMSVTSGALVKCDEIIEALKDGTSRFNIDTLSDLAYAIRLIISYCQLPNWRLASVVSAITAVFNDLYGYVIKVPETCQD